MVYTKDALPIDSSIQADAGPAIQKEVTDTLKGLSHGRLINTIEGLLGGTAVEAIPVTEYDGSQHETQARVKGLMSETDRLTSQALEQLRKEGPHKEAVLLPRDVFESAMSLATVEAQKAKSDGDAEKATKALENALVLNILGGTDEEAANAVNEIVCVGMAQELLTAARNLEGVVSLSNRWHGVVDIPSRLESSMDLIRVATNTDFDERFEHPKPLVRDGEPAQDTIKRDEIIDRLKHRELTTLAKEAVGHEGGMRRASKFMQKALESLASESVTSYDLDSEEVALTISLAADIAETTNDEKLQNMLNQSLEQLRDVRVAGLKPYRINTHNAIILDRTLVALVKEGRTKEAQALLSSSRADNSTHGDYNLWHPLTSGEATDPEQRSGLITTLDQLQAQKAADLRDVLSLNGVADEIIDTIIEHTPDPDSALGVSPEFWQVFSDFYAPTDHDPKINYARTNLIDLMLTSDSTQLATKAEAVMKLFDLPVLEQIPQLLSYAIGTLRSYKDSLARAENMAQALSLEGMTDLAQYESEKLVHRLFFEIMSSDSPQEVAKQALELYASVDFLQEAGIRPDFSGHIGEWLEFVGHIPSGKEGELVKGLIIARLKLGIEDETESMRIFKNLEVDIARKRSVNELGSELISLLHSSESVRGFPSAKDKRLGEVFFDAKLGQLYQQLYALKLAGDATGIEALMKDRLFGEHQVEHELADLIGQLKEGVEDLRAQERAAKSWLRQYCGQNIAATKLIEAWKSRSIALKHGVKDNPKDILNFVAEYGVMLFIEQQIEDGNTLLTLEDIKAEGKLITEMGARYAPDTVFAALKEVILFEHEHGPYPKKVIDQAKESIDGGGQSYSAEVLAPNDPRGFTIGFDTGCCMTLGGASESCIWAGYEDPRYSFFAVYDEKGKLRAQSLLYFVDYKDQKTLVIDNIEVNEGTDLSVIAELYKQALLKIAADQGLELDAIQVGVGYTADDIIASLPDAEIAPPTPRIGTYTDARRQKVLWSRN